MLYHKYIKNTKYEYRDWDFFFTRRRLVDRCCDLRSIERTCEMTEDASNENESVRILSMYVCDPVLSPLVGTWSSYDLLFVLLPLEVRTVNLAIPTVTTWRFSARLLRACRTRACVRACVSRCFKPDPFRCLNERTKKFSLEAKKNDRNELG